MDNKSAYGDRKTVGAIYRDAQLAKHDEFVTNGDLTNELQSSLVEDLNETITDGTKDFGGRPFYITVHEKKDLQMPRAILRRILKTLYRPYPEDDTLVFYHDPRSFKTYFCWCLPHWSEMDNMLDCESLYEPEMITQIRAWKNLDLYHFGFTKDEIGDWKANPNWKDSPMDLPRKSKLLEPSKFVFLQ